MLICVTEHREVTVRQRPSCILRFCLHYSTRGPCAKCGNLLSGLLAVRGLVSSPHGQSLECDGRVSWHRWVPWTGQLGASVFVHSLHRQRDEHFLHFKHSRLLPNGFKVVLKWFNFPQVQNVCLKWFAFVWPASKCQGSLIRRDVK